MYSNVVSGPIVSFLFLFQLFLLPAAKAQEPPISAFTDPAKTIHMGKEWESRSIIHERQAEKADLSVVLDQHLYPALLPLIEEFSKKNNLKVAILSGTCGISAGKLREKKADMAGFCCPAGETDRLPGLSFHTIGIGSLALLINRVNPLNNLPLKSARDIFRGRINHWKVFGKDIPSGTGDEIIRPIGRLHCKARPGHWRLILDNEELFSARLHEVSTIPDMIAGIERKQGAIGYEVLWMVEKYKKGNKIKILSIDGYSPYDKEALVAGKYPFYRTLNITTWTSESAKNIEADKLADYLIRNAQRIDPRYGIIPVQKLRKAGWKFIGNELTGERD